jgi:hypothetical protein
MTHREAMTSPRGEDWRGLRDGKEPPECNGELIDSNPGCYSSDIYWTVFTCAKCFAVVFTVEGTRHWWNHEGEGSSARMAAIETLRRNTADQAG